MSKTITMPQLGLTMEEGTVSSWVKKPGDIVKKDDVILTVSTDKVDMDVEATEDGVLKEILIAEGEVVPVGAVLAYFEVSGHIGDSLVAKPAPDSAPAAKSIDPKSPKSGSLGDHRQSNIGTTAREVAAVEAVASPRARRRAKELGIDIETIKGSGENGRIVEEDLLNAARQKSTPKLQDGETRRRRLIADKMLESINTIPAFSISVELNAEKLAIGYEDIRRGSTEPGHAKLSYSDLLLRAIGLSLANSPSMGVIWRDENIQKIPNTNVALAIATERGVVAPVLRNVNELTLHDIRLRRFELTDRTRQNKLTALDFEDAVGTLSNLGMYRVDSFEAIISPGQTFILAVGMLRNRPWADIALSIKPTIILNLSVDHRVADGATAAAFLEKIGEIIENPDDQLFSIER